MNYQAFTDEALLMMHYGTRGALAVDDELTRLGAECRFRVRENFDWKQHADDLEAEMRRRGMNFQAIDWIAIPEGPGVGEGATLQPAAPSSERAGDGPTAEIEDGDARLKRRIAAILKMS